MRNSSAYVLALAIFVFDQITKWLMIGPLALRERGQIELLPIFNLTWVENRGISLGLFTADSELGRWLLVAMTAAIAVGVAWWIRSEESRGDQFALALLLGGDQLLEGLVVGVLEL